MCKLHDFKSVQIIYMQLFLLAKLLFQLKVTGNDSDENEEDRTSLIEPDGELNGRRSFM